MLKRYGHYNRTVLVWVYHQMMIDIKKKGIKMSKVKKQTAKAKKEPKTIKRSTVIISVLVLIALIASYIGGIVTANSFNDSVNTKIEVKAKQLAELKENQ